MSKNLLALIFAVGAGALVYSQVAKRIGQTNTKNLWLTIAITFVAVYLLLIVTFTWVVHFK